jgi:16S rRNA (cytosine967-C5)-methyltransferase
VTPSARIEASVELLDDILDNISKPADQIVTTYFRGRRYIGGSDRRDISSRVYGILRRYFSLSWMIQAAQGEVTGRLLVLADDPNTSSCFTGERHQPSALTSQEKSILAKLSDIGMPEWAQLNVPDWVLERLRAAYPDCKELVASFSEPAPFDLRVNTLKSTRDKVLDALRAEGIEASATPLSPWGIRLSDRRPLSSSPIYQKGWVDVQDEGSQLIAVLTDAKPGMAVVDYCAGAGGKTLAIAASMQNKGTLVALDTASWRLDRAGERLRRAGATSVQRRSLDEDATRQWLRRQNGRFDRVVVDAPCTGTGTWRRNPDARLKLTHEDVINLVKLQGEILAQAAPLVKPGGRLVYATCSILPEENQQQVEAFLSQNPAFRLIPVGEVWAELLDSICPVDQPTLQLTPNRHGTDGFFVAVMERVE